MNTALFSYGKETIPGPESKTSTLVNKRELFMKLRERDMIPIVSLGAESAFDSQRVAIHELDGEFITRSAGHLALGDVGVVINLLDRSFKLDKLPGEWNDLATPTVNENTVRSLAFRKEQMQREVLDDLNLGMPTQLIEHAYDIAIFAHENPADAYIIKPNSGSYSQGIRTMTYDEAIRDFAANPPSKKMIIQPKFNFEGKFHPDLKPYDAISKEPFDSWNATDAAKELRMYAFYSPKGLNIFPVARAIKDGSEQWLFVDPDSVPTELYRDTGAAIKSIAQLKGAKAIQAAVDYGYGSLNGADPAHHIIELNGKMPYVIGYDKHPDVASALRDHYADMLRGTVDSQ